MGILVRLIGSGIGLASEAYQARKESKVAHSPRPLPAVAGPSNIPISNLTDDAPPQYAKVSDERAEALIATGQAIPIDERKQIVSDDESSDSEDEPDYSLEDDEQDWPLDTADPPSYSEAVQDGIAQHVNDVNLPPPSASTVINLACPVIGPSHRASSKDREFIRTYAPSLAAYGIGQAMFLNFLENFRQEARAPTAFTAHFIEVGMAGLAPSVIAMAVAMATQGRPESGEEVRIRHRADAFLYKMNKELFMPRGLYAMMIKYQSQNSASSRTTVRPEMSNPSGEITEFGARDQLTIMGSNMSDLRLPASTTKGESNIPTIALADPPALLSDGAIPIRGMTQRNIERCARKDDKRARKEEKWARKAEKRTYRDEKRIARGKEPRGPRRRQQKWWIEGERKTLKEDVLYLAIVNMPSPAKMEEARQAFAQ